jgi:probable rRNA maturation factor
LARFLAQAKAAVGLMGQVTVLLTTDPAIRRLNRQFRGKNKATDVLSFPAIAVPGMQGGEPLAGDLAISVPIALRQAAEQGHALSVEIKVLILHGLLHLAGYDHEADAGRMARRERLLRAKLNLPEGLIERAVVSKVATRKTPAEVGCPIHSAAYGGMGGKAQTSTRKSGRPKLPPRPPSKRSARP